MGSGQGSGIWAFRLRFRKSGPARFLSHRDLLRIFERSLRRAGFRLAISQGYNPHPRIRVRPAVALGVLTRAAALEVLLEEDPPLAELTATLADQLPEGLTVTETHALPSARPAPMTSVQWRIPPPALERDPFQEARAEALPLEGSLSRQSDGALLVTLLPDPGRDPPGARALIEALAPGEEPESLLRGMEMVRVEFADQL
ncbi:MAG: TIGR03936 family radical SAM-associated protein [Planctomycetota bacterium]|jgi:hypothetical protein